MVDAILPTSRLDALVVVISATAAVFFGVGPRYDSQPAKWLTVIANIYAIGTAMQTIRQLMELTNILANAFHLYVLLTSVTIVTSVLVIIAAFKDVGTGHCVVLMVYGVASTTYVGGCFFLYQLYSTDCDAALCNHSVAVVFAVLIAASAVATAIAVKIIHRLKQTEERGQMVYQDCEAQDGESPLQPPSVALMIRLSALSKAAVVAVYWFLVNKDMEWGEIMDYGVGWWVTGQFVKHSVAVLNNALNNC